MTKKKLNENQMELVKEINLEVDFCNELRAFIQSHPLKNATEIVAILVYEATWMALHTAPHEHCALGTIQEEICNAYSNWEAEKSLEI